MPTALIQAGGKSLRMRQSMGPAHKSLVPVLGLSTLERNLCRLLAAGFESIVVVTSQAEIEIVDFVAGRGTQLARSRGARIKCLREEQPLGTIGAAALLAADACPLLVLYSDNLMALDLQQYLEHHVQAGSAMTLATHEEPFQIPFGEVVARGGRIVDYREKSVHPIRISSGIYLLGPSALAAITPGERLDSPQLVLRLLGQGELVADYPHRDLWLDMNDAAALARLEELIATHPEQLEWLPGAADHAGKLFVRVCGTRVAREVREQTEPADRESAPGGPALASFDEIDIDSGKVVRWHVQLEAALPAEQTADFVEPAEAAAGASGRAARALAYAARQLAARSV
ncbi:MAG: sugar phosphate nucleotidyltransferase [Pirellulales bacterium]